MERWSVVVGLMMILMVSSSATATARQLACDVGVEKLKECMPAVEYGSTAKPTETCCIVVQNADLKCLCSHRSELSSVPFIDPKLALELPQRCNLRSVPAECL